MHYLKTLVLLLPMLAEGLMPGSTVAAPAAPKFNASELKGPGEELSVGDLDGDHLKDIVMIEGTNLWIFYQGPKGTFPSAPNQIYIGCDKPGIVWPAKFGGEAESLLLMTSEGVTELCFTNRTAPPFRHEILHEPTIIPDELDQPSLKHFCFAARAATNEWPLLLVPTTGGVQVWQHRQGWARIQTIESAFRQWLLPSPQPPGYRVSIGLDDGIADVNGDQRDDLMIRRGEADGKETFALYIQNPSGQFEWQAALTATNKHDERTWLCWNDLNKDGKVDLIKSTWLNEPWFIPGFRSGKVLVGVHLADAQGRLPAEPQYVFRKNDWMSMLPVVDVDGDGFADLAMGYSLFDSKEGVRKLVTARKLDFNLKFFFWHPGAGYSKEADYQRDLVIHLDRAMLEFGLNRDDFDRFVKLTGDFNGDGKRDLLVRDRSDQVSVYFFLSKQQGFSAEPSARFNCADPVEWLEVEDLNGDGVSDVLVKIHNRNAFKTFISERN